MIDFLSDLLSDEMLNALNSTNNKECPGCGVKSLLETPKVIGFYCGSVLEKDVTFKQSLVCKRHADVVEAQRWIPVSERMPPKHQEVEGVLRSKTGRQIVRSITRVDDSGHTWKSGGDILECWTVTHYREYGPLPEQVA